MSTAYYHCPAGRDCAHSEAFDPTHGTDDPAVPASSDVAHDRMVAHLAQVHQVPDDEAGPLMAAARRDRSKPAPSVRLLRDMWRAGDAR